jgi:cyclohexanone monooxygenase
MTGALREIDVRTSDGAVLRDHWEGGPLTYLGLMVSGFPNMFVVTGPGSPGVKTQMIASIEQHVDWIADCIGHMRKGGFDRIEASPQAELEWVSTSTRWPTRRSIRWPTAGTWAPTSPASRGCSCPMSAASTATSGTATPSRPRATRF